jgi:hypothetical protein
MECAKKRSNKRKRNNDIPDKNISIELLQKEMEHIVDKNTNRKPIVYFKSPQTIVFDIEFINKVLQDITIFLNCNVSIDMLRYYVKDKDIQQVSEYFTTNHIISLVPLCFYLAYDIGEEKSCLIITQDFDLSDPTQLYKNYSSIMRLSVTFNCTEYDKLINCIESTHLNNLDKNPSNNLTPSKSLGEKIIEKYNVLLSSDNRLKKCISCKIYCSTDCFIPNWGDEDTCEFCSFENAFKTKC